MKAMNFDYVFRKGISYLVIEHLVQNTRIKVAEYSLLLLKVQRTRIFVEEYLIIIY